MLSSFLSPNRTAWLDRFRKRKSASSRPLLATSDDGLSDREEDDDDLSNDHRRPGVAAEDDDEASSEDGDDDIGEATSVLPIFSAAHLDSLPVYDLTHAIRLLIVQRCETTLSWDQLRSPQISQFMVKPILQEIRSTHFSRAILYVLVANCLQFYKEGQANPGNVGVSKTRALVAELLAIRLLKEFDTRPLIDALSYDFDPLNGMVQATARPRLSIIAMFPSAEAMQPSRSARISTLEVAIKAQAKRFLAHPLVVQHLEAIWAGTIVFHSAADSLHRYPLKPRFKHGRNYGATHPPSASVMDVPERGRQPRLGGSREPIRRSVTLYDAKNASLLKLSRLRVPRYRQAFSTLSYAIMLGLYLAVLIERSLDITPLEVLFWFWSAGFMLDEIVGFTEQGFSLYIMSVWNAFDLGILLLFFIYYVLRLYGVITGEEERNGISDWAYDVLASSAVLLFPRICNFLDHYRYFSQLLIAFRLMAQDLAAVLILIVVSCSGFLVAFTLSFGNREVGVTGVAYALFQILMGYSPAAWTAWDDYNTLGRALLAFFVLICHFLVVTILITVLTNSFMAIVANANEEHQFLFAVNTISMVKSDALFSYVAPTNILGWLFSPVRYCIPFREYVRWNRYLIKATHFPCLFAIFIYERTRLARLSQGPTELVERAGRSAQRVPTFAKGNNEDVFETGPRLREPSITTHRKDHALDEVFRRPYQGDSIRKPLESTDRRSNEVSNWMNVMGNEGGPSPPLEQPRSILEHLESGRPTLRRAMTSQGLGSTRRQNSSHTRSRLSETDLSHTARRRPHRIDEEDLLMETDADGDDELLVHEDDDAELTSLTQEYAEKENILQPQMMTPGVFGLRGGAHFITTQPTSNSQDPMQFSSTEVSPNATRSSPQLRFHGHTRNASTNTIVFKPLPKNTDGNQSSSSASPAKSPPKQKSRKSSRPSSGTVTRLQSGHQTPKREMLSTSAVTKFNPSKAMPIPGSHPPGPQNMARFMDLTTRNNLRRPSVDTFALDLASDIGDNRFVGGAGFGGPDASANLLSSSFQTQMHAFHQAEAMRKRYQNENEDAGRMGRIVLARMNTLEEGFRDILKEVRDWRTAASATASMAPSRDVSGGEETVAGSGRNRNQKPAAR